MQGDARPVFSIQDVVDRFSALPDELETIIDNKKLGMSNPGSGKWDNCDLEVLEKGLAAIRDKESYDFYREVGEFFVSVLFLIVEAVIVIENLHKHSPAFLATVIANSKLILLVSIPLLVVKELINGGEASLFPTTETPMSRIVKREIRAIIGIIVILDIINLMVGA